MNIEDIKVGETYNVRMKVTHKEKDQVKVKNPMVSVYGCDYMIISHKYIHAIHEQPKYDPCRKFRKGDKVELKEEINGRRLSDFVTGLSLGKTYTVKANEDNCTVLIDSDNGLCRYSFIHLQLVTPVEEREPYYVSTNIDCSTCTIFKRVGEKKLVYSAYYFVHGNGCSNAILGITEAQAAAEAECRRLNAEYRKEHGND